MLISHSTKRTFKAAEPPSGRAEAALSLRSQGESQCGRWESGWREAGGHELQLIACGYLSFWGSNGFVK